MKSSLNIHGQHWKNVSENSDNIFFYLTQSIHLFPPIHCVPLNSSNLRKYILPLVILATYADVPVIVIYNSRDRQYFIFRVAFENKWKLRYINVFIRCLRLRYTNTSCIYIVLYIANSIPILINCDFEDCKFDKMTRLLKFNI